VIWIWLAFILFVLLMLALDLGVFHRHAHVVTVREALVWSAIWLSLGLLFSIFVYFGYENQWLGLGTKIDAVGGQPNDGVDATVKYLTGYVVEKSLSVDNIFVIAMIFGFLAVPPIYQHRVLFWGIIGALAMRGVMIGIGAELIARYHWILYVFGVFLIATAVKMLVVREHSDPAQNIVVRWTKRVFPVTDRFHGERFLVRAGSAAAREAAVAGEEPLPDRAAESAKPGTLMLTPLALALILVETTDLIFAVDSIPAIFAITADPFLVFTSNVFAILGLRSLYFALAGMMDRFRYLKVSLATVLAVIGVKMLLAEPLKAALGPGFNLYLLFVVLTILAAGVLASLWTGPEIEPEQLLHAQDHAPADSDEEDSDGKPAMLKRSESVRSD
jgi:tellurite resistance protein TerC